MKLAIRMTRQYKKDYKRLRKSGYDMQKLESVIDSLARNDTLPMRYSDHALRGTMHGTRECHIGPDWLLQYTKDNDLLILVLIGTGTHRDVLGTE